MNKHYKFLAISLCVASLSSCSSMMPETSYFYQENTYDRTPSNYLENEEVSMDQNGAGAEQNRRASVPTSYHVGQMQSPQPHKSRDKSWVNSQNPMGYTIQVADDTDAASVASKLQGAPQSNRKAQVKYNRSGQTHYKGLYGSYSNYQEAKKALDSLPESVRNSARVTNWGTIQSGVNR